MKSTIGRAFVGIGCSVLVIAAVGATASARAQAAPPSAAQAVAPSVPLATQASGAGAIPGDAAVSDADADPLAVFRAPLLREGSHIAEVAAQIVFDARLGCWRLVVENQDAAEAAHELLLMPCTRLSEMQRIVEASPSRIVQFKATGRIFVFRGRNYVLPTHAPVIMQQERPAETEAPAVKARAIAGPASESAPSGGGSTTSPDADSARSIMQQLESAAGDLTRSAAAATGRGGGAAAAGTAAQDNIGRLRGERLLAEETSIVSRRGKIARDSGGRWLFVFDADASGLADPPLRLLPCLLLERIEDYARRIGNGSPALLSGSVYLYGGQNYLLPTVFRIPQDRRNLMP